jgi:hypothetical protein
MTRIKIFLASSSALAEDRREFEIQINRKNKDWIERDTFLDLVMWEDFLDALSGTCLQDEYNKSIRECDVFVMCSRPRLVSTPKKNLRPPSGSSSFVHDNLSTDT